MTTGMTENYALRCYSDIMLTGYIFAMEFAKRCDDDGIPHSHYVHAIIFSDECARANLELKRRGSAAEMKRIGDR